MVKKLTAAITLSLFTGLASCMSLADFESGPQQLFDCKDLLQVVHKGATKASVEAAFGLTTQTMAQMPDGTIKHNVAVYAASRNLTEMRSRQLTIQYGKDNTVKNFQLYTTSHGITKEISCN
jgi:hypothetical protein